MSTRRQQIIEQVAGIIYENNLTPEEATATNKDEGWTFEVRWHDTVYTSDRNFTRVEDAKLSEVELQQALDQAEEWRNGHFAYAPA